MMSDSPGTDGSSLGPFISRFIRKVACEWDSPRLTPSCMISWVKSW